MRVLSRRMYLSVPRAPAKASTSAGSSKGGPGRGSAASPSHGLPRRSTGTGRGVACVPRLIYSGDPMNRLVAVLRRRPDVVAVAATRMRSEFSWFLEALGDDLLSPAERARIIDAPPVSRALDGSFLCAITAPEWTAGIRRAGDEPPARASEWVIMIPAGSTGLGLTAPEDASTEERLSLFAGQGDDVRPISVAPARPTRLLSAAGHCVRVPVRAVCDPGICGRCRLRRVEDGLICMCSHVE
jgi:hypothetical protein